MVKRYRNNPNNCPHCLGKGLVYSGICSFCHGSGRTDRTSWVQRNPHYRCNPCVSCALALAMLRRNPDWAEYVDEDDLGMIDQADDEALPTYWQRNPRGLRSGDWFDRTIDNAADFVFGKPSPEQLRIFRLKEAARLRADRDETDRLYEEKYKDLQGNPNAMGWICNACGEDKDDVTERYSLDLYAGRYCDVCWDNSGYRKEGAEGFDPLDAGESYDDDY